MVHGFLFDRLREVISSGVDVVICGAIDPVSAGFLVWKGVKFFPWVTGDADKVVRIYISGNLVPGLIADDFGFGGCRRRHRWRFMERKRGRGRRGRR